MYCLLGPITPHQVPRLFASRDTAYHDSNQVPACPCDASRCVRDSERLNLLEIHLCYSSHYSEARKRTDIYARLYTYFQAESHDGCHEDLLNHSIEHHHNQCGDIYRFHNNDSDSGNLVLLRLLF